MGIVGLNDAEGRAKFQQAVQFYKEERWSEALRLAEELSIVFVGNRDVMYLCASCLARLGRVEEASLLCDVLSTVHQDPRGVTLKAGLPEAKRDEKEAEPAKKPFRLPGFVIPAVLGLGVVGVALTVVPRIAGRGPTPIPEPVPFMEQPHVRMVQFPSDRSLGELAIRAWSYDPAFPLNGPNFWQSLGPAKGVVEVPLGKELRLTVTPGSTVDLSPLARLGPHDLQSLVLKDVDLGDSEIAVLNELSGLRLLDLSGTRITGEGLASLTRLTSLDELSLNHLPLGEIGMRYVSSRTLLRDLQADGIGATDVWLEALSEQSGIRFLSLDENTGLTDAGLKHLGKLQSLVHLFVSYTVLTDEGLAELQKLPSLERLWMEGTSVTDAGVPGFSSMRKLRSIGLAKTRITDNALETFKKMRRLEKINLRACADLTDLAVRSLRETLPDCIVETGGNVSNLPAAWEK